MRYISNITRSHGDPKVLRSGPSSLGQEERLARALGWFSIGLGAVELMIPHRITRALGMLGNERLVRAFGAREIASGLLTLSPQKQTGLRSRIAGDGLDIATLWSGWRRDNAKRYNVALALLIVGGVTLLDFIGAQAIKARHTSKRDERRSYRDRIGFPMGIAAVRGAAKQFQASPQMRIASTQGAAQPSANLSP